MKIKLNIDRSFLDSASMAKPVIIAGPCSAESEEQTIETAKHISKLGVKIFRAGIWKPRTRPNSFEGHGAKALPWLKRVKEETGMYIATEVANGKHVNEALKSGVDILWIGARTTTNPFTVQEIAENLRGIDIPVFVKNPINPDVELWIGAIERLNYIGITKLVAIHRGFSVYEKLLFKNNPQWQIPIELKRRIPELPLFCDPSHICGNREKIFEISQAAMDLNFNGLMIEVHNNPNIALSDSEQQLTPPMLDELLKRLVIRKSITENGCINSISELRSQIDNIDDRLMEMFEKRMKIVEKMGEYKKMNNIAILQNKRWNEILQRHLLHAESKGLSNEFIETVFKAIHQESINHQMKIMN